MQRPPRAYSDDEAHQIQQHLDSKLDSSHLSYRPAAQGTVAYLEGWKAFNLANEVFGFNGWSSEILSLTTDFLDTDASGKVSLGMSCMVRIHLRDGTFHDDIGYGSSENQKSKCAAFEKAKKEAVTDAMKRALRIFGNRLGNCAYDKMFLKEVKGKPPGNANNFVRAANYPAAKPVQPVQPALPPIHQHQQLHHHQQHQQQQAIVHRQPLPQQQPHEVVFDDSVFDSSMMISEEDLVLEEAAFLVDENSVTVANATFPSASISGIYPLPPRPNKS